MYLLVSELCAPVQQRPVITTLTRLFNETSEALGGSRANPAKKREIEDNSRKIGALYAKLNSGDISKNAAEKLVQLCQALDSGDFTTALQIQVTLFLPQIILQGRSNCNWEGNFTVHLFVSLSCLLPSSQFVCPFPDFGNLRKLSIFSYLFIFFWWFWKLSTRTNRHIFGLLK